MHYFWQRTGFDKIIVRENETEREGKYTVLWKADRVAKTNVLG